MAPDTDAQTTTVPVSEVVLSEVVPSDAADRAPASAALAMAPDSDAQTVIAADSTPADDAVPAPPPVNLARAVLTDLVRQSDGLFEAIRVTGDATSTMVRGTDKDRALFLIGHTKTVVPEFAGKFGVTRLGMLKGLLDFPGFAGAEAEFSVHRDADRVLAFRLRAPPGRAANFPTAHPDAVGQQANIPALEWEVTLTPDPASLAEFVRLAGLYSQVEEVFRVRTDGTALVFQLGDGKPTSLTASVVLAELSSNRLTQEIAFPLGLFLAVHKRAGRRVLSFRISKLKLLVVVVETDHAVYEYYLRGRL